MSNKTDLQENNARIEAFIADGQDLPPALPDELGNATPSDVLSGKTFTSDDGVMQTGGLAPNGFGDATPTDVMSGKTFSTDGGIKQTGTLAPNGFGDAAQSDVLIGKTFTSALGIMLAGALDPDTLKIGQYVWKKYNASGKTGTISVEFSTDDYLTDHWEKVVQVSGDLTTSDLTADDFIGLNMPCTVDSGMHYITFRPDGKCEGIWGGDSIRQGTYTYDPYTGIIKVYAQFGAADLFAGSIEVTKRDFLGYVISDSEDAYPDGGEQDGYWYENALKTPEQIIAPLFGMSKASFGTMMLSSHQTTQHDLVHNLGAIPKLVFLFTPEHLYALPNYIKSATIVDGYTQYDGYGTNYYFMNYLVQSSSNSSEEAFSNLDSAVPVSRATTTTIPLGDSDFIYFAQGKTYYWVAMA